MLDAIAQLSIVYISLRSLMTVLVVLISHLGLVFHFHFQFTRSYFWIWNICFQLQLNSYIGKLWYIYGIGIKINKEVPPLFPTNKKNRKNWNQTHGTYYRAFSLFIKSWNSGTSTCSKLNNFFKTYNKQTTLKHHCFKSEMKTYNASSTKSSCINIWKQNVAIESKGK